MAKQIAQTIKDMTENEAKKMLAELLISYHRLGIKGHTKEDFLKDFDLEYRNVVMADLYKK